MRSECEHHLCNPPTPQQQMMALRTYPLDKQMPQWKRTLHRSMHACMHCLCRETAAHTKSHLAVGEPPRGPAAEMKTKRQAYLASSSCFSRALRLAFLPWVLARRALASDSISSSVHSQKAEFINAGLSLQLIFLLPTHP